ncbi:hypothetical protein FSP39_024163 [Pinctada imbricata]|uniref:F-box domain-containing protein n=1 Tax=Pinctada imbricata TaxID=66713 RepID=A0AA88Y6A6_PINIB|nr:hypothetical protein FSP39_024163 [Pinctada imbricata]
MSWDQLPDLVISKILSYLDLLDRIHASKTCVKWQEASQSPEVWHRFEYSENALWELLFTAGIPCTTEDIKLFDQVSEEIQEVVQRNVRYFKHVNIALRGITSFALFIEICKNCSNLRDLSIYQLIQQHNSSESLEPLGTLLERNKELRHLRIEDMTKFGEKNSPVPMGLTHGKHMKTLWIVNSFNSNSLSNVMYLINLKELAISPKHLNFSLLRQLASHSLKELYIVANSKTREFYNEALSAFHWKEICKSGPSLRVHCFLAVSHEWAQKEVFLKPNMPLASLVYRKRTWLKYIESLSLVMTRYRETLEEFVDFALTEGPYRHPGNGDYQDRVDKHIIFMVRYCPKLKVLIIKEMLSSAALILMAFLNRGLTGLFIREDMIKYVNDLPENELIMVGDDSCRTMVRNHWTKDKLCKGMSSLLGIDWKPMTVENYREFVAQRYAKFT